MLYPIRSNCRFVMWFIAMIIASEVEFRYYILMEFNVSKGYWIFLYDY